MPNLVRALCVALLMYGGKLVCLMSLLIRGDFDVRVREGGGGVACFLLLFRSGGGGVCRFCRGIVFAPAQSQKRHG